MSRVFLSCLLCLCAASAAEAQVFIGRDVPRRGSVEIGGALTWAGSQQLPEQAALLTPNPGTGSGSFQLFNSEPKLDAAVGAQATVAFYLTPALAIEGGFRFARPNLTVQLTDDFEGAPDITASSTVTQYLFIGSLVYHFGGRGRVTPFISGGAGHARDAHDGNELVETGTEFHGTAGVKIWFASGRRKVGLRLEGGFSMIDGGFSFEDGRRTAPTAAAGIAYIF
jgi:hypothetical protein